MKVTHTLKPIYFSDSRILILGSMPSLKSREEGFYYAHPKNRFWWVISQIYNEPTPITIEDKITFLKKHNIALFDVIKVCEIKSSSDSSIKNVIPNNLLPIIKKSKITKIYTTGKKAYNLYNKYCLAQTNIPATYLPSTSPANCQKGIEEKLLEAYKEILNN